MENFTRHYKKIRDNFILSITVHHAYLILIHLYAYKIAQYVVHVTFTSIASQLEFD